MPRKRPQSEGDSVDEEETESDDDFEKPRGKRKREPVESSTPRLEESFEHQQTGAGSSKRIKTSSYRQYLEEDAEMEVAIANVETSKKKSHRKKTSTVPKQATSARTSSHSALEPKVVNINVEFPLGTSETEEDVLTMNTTQYANATTSSAISRGQA